VLDAVASSRPTWFVGENVSGIINLELDNCIADLENLGYAAQPIIIPACAVGARHRRDRVWIIAYRDRRQQKQPAEKIQTGRNSANDGVDANSKITRQQRGDATRHPCADGQLGEIRQAFLLVCCNLFSELFFYSFLFSIILLVFNLL